MLTLARRAYALVEGSAAGVYANEYLDQLIEEKVTEQKGWPFPRSLAPASAAASSSPGGTWA